MILDDLLGKYRSYEADSNAELVKRAYAFAETAHMGERRFGCFPFIEHPLAVAMLLVEIQAEGELLAAALLHDVLEHTNLAKEDLIADFGPEIADLVDGVSVVQRVSQKAGGKGTGENLTKLLLAMVHDPRVLMVRMAEEVDNLRNLDAFPEKERETTLDKAFEVYAPLARLLRVGTFGTKLEDLAFEQRDPEKFSEISRKIAALTQGRQGEISNLIKRLEARLAREGIEAEITTRTKHAYGVYRKLPRYAELSGGVWHDVLGLRVIADDPERCYSALSIVHELGKPDPRFFDDYIAHPKPNGYQSLHTVIWFNSVPMEIQIRTREMHARAEFGLAAHAFYKEAGGPSVTSDEKVKLLQSLIGWEKERGLNLFADKVFVLTPKADVVDLPNGASPVDFAFAVHTGLGGSCAGAKVNGEMVPLNYRLQNGDRVEILTARGRKPSVDWLKFVKTGLARSQIKKALR